jgi:hypothetical protein
MNAHLPSHTRMVTSMPSACPSRGGRAPRVFALTLRNRRRRPGFALRPVSSIELTRGPVKSNIVPASPRPPSGGPRLSASPGGTLRAKVLTFGEGYAARR